MLQKYMVLLYFILRFILKYMYVHISNVTNVVVVAVVQLTGERLDVIIVHIWGYESLPERHSWCYT